VVDEHEGSTFTDADDFDDELDLTLAFIEERHDEVTATNHPPTPAQSSRAHGDREKLRQVRSV
jgi:hypothetical protein